MSGLLFLEGMFLVPGAYDHDKPQIRSIYPPVPGAQHKKQVN